MQAAGTLTLLLPDIDASRRPVQQLGDDRHALALDQHRRLLPGAFASHDGYEVNCEGDSLFVAFSSASEAVAAAEQAQRALALHSWPDSLPVRVRIGIHTGQPALAPPKYVDVDVHQEARVMAAAHGGQVLVTETTRASNGARFVFVDMGEHGLKDTPVPVRRHQLEVAGLESEFSGRVQAAMRGEGGRGLCGRDSRAPRSSCSRWLWWP
jgi:class 3 adenylate cyclase